MKYGIWRHENSIGNSAEHVIGLCKHLARNPDPDAEIFVETEFQRWFAMCIPYVKPENVKIFPLPNMASMSDQKIYEHAFFTDVVMPSCYPFRSTYPATWTDLAKSPDVTLRFPEEVYDINPDLPTGAIVFHIRERGTYNKRFVGSQEESERFNNQEIFIPLLLELADRGYKLVRVGDKNQTPLPEHENIIDFALSGTGKIEDELYMIANSKLFISTDSGIWPMVAGMKKKLLFTNVTSPYTNMTEKINVKDRKFSEAPDRIELESEEDEKRYIEAAIPVSKMKLDIVRWVPLKTTKLLFKRFVWTEDKEQGSLFATPPREMIYWALKMLGDI